MLYEVITQYYGYARKTVFADIQKRPGFPVISHAAVPFAVSTCIIVAAAVRIQKISADKAGLLKRVYEQVVTFAFGNGDNKRTVFIGGSAVAVTGFF